LGENHPKKDLPPPFFKGLPLRGILRGGCPWRVNLFGKGFPKEPPGEKFFKTPQKEGG